MRGGIAALRQIHWIQDAVSDAYRDCPVQLTTVGGGGLDTAEVDEVAVEVTGTCSIAWQQKKRDLPAPSARLTEETLPNSNSNP